jgi:hypothetical protein
MSVLLRKYDPTQEGFVVLVLICLHDHGYQYYDLREKNEKENKIRRRSYVCNSLAENPCIGVTVNMCTGVTVYKNLYGHVTSL